LWPNRGAVAERSPKRPHQILSVVLDTNVVVSALLKLLSLEDQVLRLALSGYVKLILSPPIVAEYASVLPRPKLKLKAAEVKHALREINKIGTLIHPSQIVKAPTTIPTIAFWSAPKLLGPII
jgi:predicted nucleic acid-binding protein